MLVVALFVIVLCVYKHTQAGMGTYAQCQIQAQTRCDCRNFLFKGRFTLLGERSAHHLCWKALSGSSMQGFSP